MHEFIARGVPAQNRSDKYADFLSRLTQFDTRQQADTAQIKQLFAREDK
jgi:malonate decarboxylase beta subunit